MMYVLAHRPGLGAEPFFPLLRQFIMQEVEVAKQIEVGATTPAPTPTPSPTPSPVASPAPPAVTPTMVVPTTDGLVLPDALPVRRELVTTFMPGEIITPTPPPPTRGGEVIPQPITPAFGGNLVWIAAVGLGLFFVFGQRRRRR